MIKCLVGLDLGQASDFTALSVLDIIPTKYEKKIEDLHPFHRVPQDRKVIVEGLPLAYHIRHLERLPIGTSYPEVVVRVKEVMTRLPVGAGLVVDNTGVGRPVTDMIIQQGLHPVCITITGGDTVTNDGPNFHVPKRDIVGVLAVALQTKQLKIASSLPDAQTLVNELLNFKVKINLKTAHDSYEAWREGIHDDLVLSVGMAVWTAHFLYSHQARTVYMLEDDYRI
ncbi:MAG: hypothetical protein WC294_02240 [Methanoregula sp.]|jgi:hypothetical protein